MQIVSTFKKIVKKFIFTTNIQQEKIDHFKNINIHESSILIKKECLDFRVSVEDRKYVSIGEKCIINAKFIFETPKGEVIIGNNVQLGGVIFISKDRIEIGNDVTMAWDIIIYDHNSHSTNWDERKNDNSQVYNDYINCNGNNIVNKDWTNVKTASVKIGDKVWIGFGAVILKGVNIGEGAVVGARSVVTKDIEPWTVVGGNPAKIIRRLK